MYDEKVRLRDYAGLVLGAPFFQLALGLAAVIAQYRHLRKRTNWVKTTHVGAHLDAAARAQQVIHR